MNSVLHLRVSLYLTQWSILPELLSIFVTWNNWENISSLSPTPGMGKGFASAHSDGTISPPGWREALKEWSTFTKKTMQWLWLMLAFRPLSRLGLAFRACIQTSQSTVQHANQLVTAHLPATKTCFRVVPMHWLPAKFTCWEIGERWLDLTARSLDKGQRTVFRLHKYNHEP